MVNQELSPGFCRYKTYKIDKSKIQGYSQQHQASNVYCKILETRANDFQAIFSLFDCFDLFLKADSFACAD